ncbi:MAG TPA: LLM class flavin-dependent oxidoreductase [Thermomicrobiales bacterium]|nr:LLM class flavin-dependent oxidoreductase [Thermomicrobiales bacterium]
MQPPQTGSSPDSTPRFCIVLGQRLPWPELLARTRETETLGFDALFLVDHFYGLFDVNEPTHEAYTMLGALAPFTQRLRLGVMVAGNTYRHPVVLLKQAISVDHVSGGRVDFGVGAGWTEREHEAYGILFPPARERVDRFEEALEVWDLLQREERSTYDGRYYQLLDAPFQPKSLQSPRLPLLIGATKPRMLRLTVRHADMWNAVATPEEGERLNRQLDALCEEQGRDPASLVRAVSPSINLLESVEAFERGVAAYHAAGFRDIYVPWPRTEAEVPVMRAVARDVIPGLRGQRVWPPAPGDTQPQRRQIEPDDVPIVAEILVSLGDGTARRVLDLLVEHPDERFDGAAIVRHLDLAEHADVARAIGTLGDAFARHGIDRPWNEAQRGYLLPADRAGILAQGRTHTA